MLRVNNVDLRTYVWREKRKSLRKKDKTRNSAIPFDPPGGPPSSTNLTQTTNQTELLLCDCIQVEPSLAAARANPQYSVSGQYAGKLHCVTMTALTN